ncbi:hypothetical protein B0T12DRAFT_369291, partial [Alternaria alternata]
MPKQDSPENRYYLETHPYVSFGDNGTTASLNAFGDIIQISQAHGSSRSGFFCVDQPEVPEPFSVQLRAEKIMNAREIDGEGVYAYTYTQDEDLHETLGMRHEFIHDRWPLFTTEYSHITYKVLHVAFQGTIFQQYVWSTKSSPINYSSGLDISDPELHHDEDFRDAYWHRTFEIPYVLWTNRDSNLFQHASKNDVAQGLKDSKESSIDSTQLLKCLIANSPASESYPTQMVMKKRMPFNNVIVQQSIVELSDEWLYKRPNFFRGGLFESCPVWNQNAEFTSSGTVIDIPRTDHTKGYRDPLSGITLLSNQSMYAKLRQERTVEDNKKRLIWITNLNTDTQEICCAIAEHEKDSLKSFFKKHKTNAKYFSDEVTATANLWTTELHLSSYRILDEARDYKGADMTFLGNETTFIERAGASFRLTGDFFDRYWNCHVIGIGLESTLPFEEGLRKALEPTKLNLDFEPHKKPWKQRKVLELLLLDQMLGELAKRYQNIIDKTGIRLKELFPHATKEGDSTGTIISISNELFSKQMNNGAYLIFRKT